MNKKAFTLIELMSIIVILGLLMTLLIPRINGIYKDSKKKIYYESTKNLVKAFDEYYVRIRISNHFEGCSYNFSNDSSTCTDFSFDGNKPDSGAITLMSDGSVNGSVSFDSFSYIVDDGSVFEDTNEED